MDVYVKYPTWELKEMKSKKFNVEWESLKSKRYEWLETVDSHFDNKRNERKEKNEKWVGYPKSLIYEYLFRILFIVSFSS